MRSWRHLLVQGALLGLVDLQQPLAELDQRAVGSCRAARGRLVEPVQQAAQFVCLRLAPRSAEDADEIEHGVADLRARKDLAARPGIVGGDAFGGGGVALACSALPCLGPRCIQPHRGDDGAKLLRLVDDVADQAKPAVFLGQRGHDVGIGRMLARTCLVGQIDQFGGPFRHLDQKPVVLLGRGREPPKLGRVKAQIVLRSSDGRGLFGRARGSRQPLQFLPCPIGQGMEAICRLAPVGRRHDDVAVALGSRDQQIAIDAAGQYSAAAGKIRLAQQEPRRRRDNRSDRDRNAPNEENLGRYAQSQASGPTQCKRQANRPDRTEKCSASPP